MTRGAITTVVADFGGVLSTPLAGAFEHARTQLGLAPEALGAAMAAAEAARGSHPLHELETGRLTERAFYELLEAQLGRPAALDRFSALWWEALGANDELIDHLRGVRGRGYRLGLLTNNVREWQPHWHALVPVEELFSVVVDSAWVGLRKPDPAVYALTTERLGVRPSEVVLLDDFETNCEGARAAGWSAVRFDTTAQAVAELEALLADRGAPPGIGPAAGG